MASESQRAAAGSPGPSHSFRVTLQVDIYDFEDHICFYFAQALSLTMAWDDFSAFKRLNQWPTSLERPGFGRGWRGTVSEFLSLFRKHRLLQHSPHVFSLFVSLRGYKIEPSRCCVRRKFLFWHCVPFCKTVLGLLGKGRAQARSNGGTFFLGLLFPKRKT